MIGRLYVDGIERDAKMLASATVGGRAACAGGWADGCVPPNADGGPNVDVPNAGCTDVEPNGFSGTVDEPKGDEEFNGLFVVAAPGRGPNGFAGAVDAPNGDEVFNGLLVVVAPGRGPNGFTGAVVVGAGAGAVVVEDPPSPIEPNPDNPTGWPNPDAGWPNADPKALCGAAPVLGASSGFELAGGGCA